jgi:hypothetical protein
MKAFFSWLAITLVAFGGLGGGYHMVLASDPHRVLVVVDSSFGMKADWGRVLRILDKIDDERYSRFALATEKGPVHGYKERLDAGRLTPYAPRDFSGLGSLENAPELAGAAEYVLVTNAPASETGGLSGWTVIRP